MQLPLHIKYWGLPVSDAVSTLIREHAQELERFRGYLTSGRVAVELWHFHHQQGTQYRVVLELSVREELGLSDDELEIAREAAIDADRNQLQVLIEEVFAEAARVLERAVGTPHSHHAHLATAEERRLGPLHGRVPSGQAYVHDWRAEESSDG